MITSLAAVLEELRTAEAAQLAKHNIKHGPTIGNMYEGLTNDILSRAVPPELGLRVVEGFVEGLDGELSNQADVLVVRGEGKPIPYTDSFIWSIGKVLAVLEVKKTLYGSALSDSFAKMRRVSELNKQFYLSGGHNGKAISVGHRNFAKTTGFFPKFQDVNSLVDPLPAIHHIHLQEQLGPVKIILGYEGYTNEAGLRDGISALIEKNGTGANRGFLSLPNLVICKTNSVVKLNGMPYFMPMDEPTGWWHVMASNAENPTRILLELLWTKISAELDVSLPMDDSLGQESFLPFMRQKYVVIEQDGKKNSGFLVETIEGNISSLGDQDKADWSPNESSVIETVILLRAAQEGSIRVDDQDFQAFAAMSETTAQSVLDTLVQKRIFAWLDSEKTTARPIENTIATVFTPDGQTMMSDQHGLFGLWLNQKAGPN